MTPTPENVEAARPDWQPIATAPKDGTLILVWDGRGYNIAFWGRVGSTYNAPAWTGGHCHINHIDQPTHWMRLPAEPREG